MDQQRKSCCGVLPAQAPLASPYVPFQPKEPDQYPARRGLIRGTMFPCLDFPFLGMENTEEKTDTALHELQALGFAVQELSLYLDTHADDAEAVDLYQKYADLYQTGMAQYQQTYGPLEKLYAVRDGAYAWTDAPWPWELAANEEG